MDFLPTWLRRSLQAALDPTGAYTPLVIPFEVVAGLMVVCLVMAALMLVVKRKGNKMTPQAITFLVLSLLLAASALMATAGLSLGASVFFWIPFLGTAAVLLALLAAGCLRGYFSLPLMGKIGVGTLVVTAIWVGRFAPQGGLLVQKLLLIMSGVGLLVGSLWRLTSDVSRGFWLFLSIAASLTLLLPRVSIEVAAGSLPDSAALSALAAALFCLRWAVPLGLLLGLGMVATISPSLGIEDLPRMVTSGKVLAAGIILTMVVFIAMGLGKGSNFGGDWSTIENRMSGFFEGAEGDFPGWLSRSLQNFGDEMGAALRDLADGITSNFRSLFKGTPLD